MQVIELLQSSPGFFYLAIGLLGLVVGSFLNVVIVRLPQMLEREWRNDCCELLEIEKKEKDNSFNLLTPRSRCPSCKHGITALENIPVLSYFFLGGKCAKCKTKISFRYPFIELLSCVLSLLLAWQFGPTAKTILACILIWSLISLTFIDFDKLLLPDDITLTLLWLGITVNLFGLFTDIYSSVLGCIFGYLILWGVYQLFRIVTGKKGMGYGDFKLLAALGAWLGWQYIPMLILLSSIAGSIIGIIMITLFKHKQETPIPFGPYLTIAGVISLIWGEEILLFVNHL